MKTIYGEFCASAQKYPDRPALRYYQDQGWECVTYSELSGSVDTMAAGLLALSAGRVAKIAIMSENRPEWIVCYLAAVAAGATAVPIDAQSGEAETGHIIGHSGAETLICSMRCYGVVSRLLRGLPDLRNIVIFDHNITVRRDQRCSGDWQSAAAGWRKEDNRKNFFSYDEIRGLGAGRAGAPGPGLPAWEPCALASILYTSGTTGAPKDVMLTHANFISNCEAVSRVVPLDQTDNILLLLPLHHVFPFLGCLVLPLSRGACVSLVDILSRDRAQLILECRPTLMVGVPLLYSKLYRGIMRQVEASKVKNFIFKYGGKKLIGYALKKKLGGRLRFLLSGAAPMEPDVIAGFDGMGLGFLEGYGLTETSPVVSLNPPGRMKIGSVGRPLDGVRVRIEAPEDTGIGEIAVKGDLVMLGYYRNPEETARVVRDGWFYTGDLGRIDEDGYLFITGRAKDVIINRGGQKIYPEVVEGEINRSRFIAESVVIGCTTGARAGEDIGVLISPDYEALTIQAGKDGLAAGENMEAGGLTEDAKDRLIDAYRALLESEVRKAMEKLAPYQRVNRIAIERDEFVKTSTRKIKRFLYKGRLDIREIG